MVKNNLQSHYYSVGGKVKWGETSQEAVIREVFEETGIWMEVKRLAFIHENFFGENGTPHHEISFYYLMEECDLDDLVVSSITSEGFHETLHWLSEDELNQHEIYPEFFRNELDHTEEGVKHYITNDILCKKQ